MNNIGETGKERTKQKIVLAEHVTGGIKVFRIVAKRY